MPAGVPGCQFDLLDAMVQDHLERAAPAEHGAEGEDDHEHHAAEVAMAGSLRERPLTQAGNVEMIYCSVR